MMLFYFETENKILFGPPPIKKAQKIRSVAIWLHTHTHVCLYQQPVTWIFTRSRLSESAQSNPFIKNYYLIIVAFSRPLFSIYDIILTRERTLSFNARATHFK